MSARQQPIPALRLCHLRETFRTFRRQSFLSSIPTEHSIHIQATSSFSVGSSNYKLPSCMQPSRISVSLFRQLRRISEGYHCARSLGLTMKTGSDRILEKTKQCFFHFGLQPVSGSRTSREGRDISLFSTVNKIRLDRAARAQRVDLRLAPIYLSEVAFLKRMKRRRSRLQPSALSPPSVFCRRLSSCCSSFLLASFFLGSSISFAA